LDALTNTTRSLVSEFQDEVAPFAVELTQSLVRPSYAASPPCSPIADTRRSQTDSFSRLIRESLEARERTGDNLDYDDEKMLVQMNILKTIDQLTSSLDGTELIAKVEAIIAPALEVTLRNNLVGELKRG